MKNVAFIPARGGSKGIKNKNIRELKGKPLLYWTVKACVEADSVEMVFVSTDSDEIKNAVNSFGFDKVHVVTRSAQSASDNATSESALLEFCENHEFEKVIFLQATSPLTKSFDIDGAFDKMETEGSDSIIAAIKNHQFLWSTDGKPLNYDPNNRPRRQDWDGYYIENGAFYISKRGAILKSKCRISGKIDFWEMDSKTFFELDEESDWLTIEKFDFSEDQ
jgi:N-acylneuraminate cytidylyltransferase